MRPLRGSSEGTAQARAGLFLAQQEDEDLGGGSCVPSTSCTETSAETLGVGMGWGPSPHARGTTASESPHRPSSGPRGRPAGLTDGRPGQEGLARPAHAHHGTLTGGALLSTRLPGESSGRRADPVPNSAGTLRSESETQGKPEVPASPRGEALFRCARPSAPRVEPGSVYHSRDRPFALSFLRGGVWKGAEEGGGPGKLLMPPTPTSASLSALLPRPSRGRPLSRCPL